MDLETQLPEPVVVAGSEGRPSPFFSWPLGYLVVKAGFSHWPHFHFYLDTCYYSHREPVILLGWDQIRESSVSRVRGQFFETVIFRKVLQTLIMECSGAFLKNTGLYKLWASAEVLGMSRGQLSPLSPRLWCRHWG